MTCMTIKTDKHLYHNFKSDLRWQNVQYSLYNSDLTVIASHGPTWHSGSQGLKASQVNQTIHDQNIDVVQQKQTQLRFMHACVRAVEQTSCSLT